MALETVRKKLEAARKDYERETKKLGKDLRKAIVEAVAEIIPEGWYVMWRHNDQCYNDEDYYYDIDMMALVTEKEPRQGKLIKAEVSQKRGRIEDRYGYGRGYEGVIEYGSPAVYEWHVDDECVKRTDFDVDVHEDEGVVNLIDRDKPKFGLKEAERDAVKDLINGFDQSEIQSAFGVSATVRIMRNGKCKVN